MNETSLRDALETPYTTKVNYDIARDADPRTTLCGNNPPRDPRPRAPGVRDGRRMGAQP